MNSTVEYSLEFKLPGIDRLPWDKPLDEWDQNHSYIFNAPRGLSRHSVVFINTKTGLFVFKESSLDLVTKEFHNLGKINRLRVPSVIPVGYVKREGVSNLDGILITRYLEYSLPYRLLFKQTSLKRYKESLLDAMASLLVQLHLAGVYWGDCSLSNTLFKRDAGALQAYLVDAETVELSDQKLIPEARALELDVMEDNVCNDLQDTDTTLLSDGIAISEISAYVRLRYQQIWEEITNEQTIQEGEQYQIHERIRSINSLGFSVGGIDLNKTSSGSQLRMKVIVTDRNYHRDQLFSLTGLFAQENQAQKIVNEIQELRATMSISQNRDVPMTVAAYHWVDFFYKPTIKVLEENLLMVDDPVELYCQILEHKWFLSEREKHDVGHQFATEDYIAFMKKTQYLQNKLGL